MDSANMVQNKDDGKGFCGLYVWSIIYVVMTYLYPLIVSKILESDNASLLNEAEYEASKNLMKIAFAVGLIPFVFLIVNIILAISMKKVHRRRLLNAVRIIKYSLIPFFVIGGIVIALFFLLMFTPVIIMVFVSPFVITLLSVMGWVSMVGSAPLVIAYLVKSVRDGVNGSGFAVVISIMQFFFCADVIGTIICGIKERQKKH